MKASYEDFVRDRKLTDRADGKPAHLADYLHTMHRLLEAVPPARPGVDGYTLVPEADQRSRYYDDRSDPGTEVRRFDIQPPFSTGPLPVFYTVRLTGEVGKMAEVPAGEAARRKTINVLAGHVRASRTILLGEQAARRREIDALAQRQADLARLQEELIQEARRADLEASAPLAAAAANAVASSAISTAKPAGTPPRPSSPSGSSSQTSPAKRPA